MTTVPRPISSHNQKQIQDWLNAKGAALLRNCLTHRIAHLQSIAGEEALSVGGHDGSAVFAACVEEGRRLAAFLAMMDEFSDPDTVLHTTDVLISKE